VHGLPAFLSRPSICTLWGRPLPLSGSILSTQHEKGRIHADVEAHFREGPASLCCCRFSYVRSFPSSPCPGKAAEPHTVHRRPAPKSSSAPSSAHRPPTPSITSSPPAGLNSPYDPIALPSAGSASRTPTYGSSPTRDDTKPTFPDSSLSRLYPNIRSSTLVSHTRFTALSASGSSILGPNPKPPSYSLPGILDTSTARWDFLIGKLPRRRLSQAHSSVSVCARSGACLLPPRPMPWI